MKNLFLIFINIVLAGVLFAQSQNLPNFVDDPHQVGSSGIYETMKSGTYFAPNGYIIGGYTTFYVKNTGGSGEVNITVSLNAFGVFSDTVNQQFRVQGNTRYCFKISYPYGSPNYTKTSTNVSALFPGNPVLKKTNFYSPPFSATGPFRYFSGPPNDTLTVYIPTDVEGYPTHAPSYFVLEQNYPNPFNPTTKIKYSINKSSFVTLKVFDILGREVTTLVNEYKLSNDYEITFNASDLSSGLYFYQLNANNYLITKKFVLIK